MGGGGSSFAIYYVLNELLPKQNQTKTKQKGSKAVSTVYFDTDCTV